jgi:hypothetical protein
VTFVLVSDPSVREKTRCRQNRFHSLTKKVTQASRAVCEIRAQNVGILRKSCRGDLPAACRQALPPGGVSVGFGGQAEDGGDGAD